MLGVRWWGRTRGMLLCYKSVTYMPAGHFQGILWGPITGLAMSELVLDGHAECVDLEPFSPSRFMPTAAFGTRGRKRGSTAVGEQW